jgi:nucleoside 2-deoxyribosyltransferase
MKIGADHTDSYDMLKAQIKNHEEMPMMHVYVAHPAFTDVQKEFKEKFFKGLQEQLDRLKHCATVKLIDPFDHSPNVEGCIAEKLSHAREIRESCLSLLDQCKLLVALIDDDDTGTAFEAGYAYHAGIPVIIVSKGNCDEANAMLLGAAHARFDNILDTFQLSLLAGLIEWHYLQLLGPRLVPPHE